MNKTKIEWTDYTWNPVTGCLRDCWYCYVKRITGYNRTPAFHHHRLTYPMHIKKPSKVFVCSTADLFGRWIQESWIWEVLSMAKTTGWHTFQFLTKNPKRMQDFPFEKNMWIGTTIDEIQHEQRIIDLKLTRHKNLFLSFEPLITPMPLTPFILADIKWIIIGGMTGKDAIQPHKDWILQILERATFFNIPVFMKNNLKYVWKGLLRQEFPE